MVRRWFTFALFALLVAVLPARVARADQSTAHTVSVAVLAFDSDDAEEQADALTGSLRSRIRASQGWSLVETSQSLGMLTAALRCSSKPIGAECEQRIADQIKSERYVYGYVTKGPQSGQVTAEVHLYQKSKPDTVIRETYADNLKDQNDDTLRAIAQRLLDRLGSNALGTLVVRLGSENGEIVIDGDKRVSLQKGVARLELSPGSHSVEVAAASATPSKRNVLVTVGKETVVDLTLTTPPPAEPVTPATTFPTRKVVGGGLALGGAALLAVGTINFLAWRDDQDRFAAYQANGLVPSDAKIVGDPSDVCDSADGRASHSTACKIKDDRIRHATIAWMTGAGGAVLAGLGVYLLVTDGGSSKDVKATGTKPRLVPTIGQGSGGLMVSGGF